MSRKTLDPQTGLLRKMTSFSQNRMRACRVLASQKKVALEKKQMWVGSLM
jgi:hypothetical protein